MLRYVDQVSVEVCVLWRALYSFSGALVAWTLVALNVDRLAYLTWPFAARVHLTERATRAMIAALVFWCALLSTLSAKVFTIAPSRVRVQSLKLS